MTIARQITPDQTCPICFGRGRYDDDGDNWIECVCVESKNFQPFTQKELKSNEY